MKVLIGTSEWSYDEWKGVFYPASLPKSDYLDYYSGVFKTAEIASTYYRLPFFNHVKNWDQRTPGDFKFTFKLIWQTTHQNRMETGEKNKKIAESFFERLQYLEKKISVVVIQPPNDLKFEPKLLSDFITMLPGGYRYAIESKDPAWQSNECLSICAKLKVIPVSYSSHKGEYFPKHAGLKDAFVRFSGKAPDNIYIYSEDELKAVRDTLLGQGYDNVWVYFSNTVQDFAIENARQFSMLV